MQASANREIFIYARLLAFVFEEPLSVYLIVTKCNISTTESLCSKALFTIQAGPYFVKKMVVSLKGLSSS